MAGVVGAGLAIYQAEMNELRKSIRSTREENGQMSREVKDQNIRIKQLQNHNAFLNHTLSELEKEYVLLRTARTDRHKRTSLTRSSSAVEQVNFTEVVGEELVAGVSLDKVDEVTCTLHANSIATLPRQRQHHHASPKLKHRHVKLNPNSAEADHPATLHVHVSSKTPTQPQSDREQSKPQ